MSNVFKYPLNQNDRFLTKDDSVLLGALSRTNDFLTSDDSDTTPYTKAYRGESGPSDRFANIPTRDATSVLEHISKFRSYYGVFSGSGLDGYPTYQSVWEEPAIYAYFHIIKFGVTSAFASGAGTLRLNCKRDSTTHLNAPSFTATNTHGMGNATTNYTSTISRKFKLSGFDTSVPSEWGNYLNFDDNGGTEFYLKVIDADTVEVYTDSGYTSPVDISSSGLNWSAYTSGGLCVGSNTTGNFQCLFATLYDRGNNQMYYYDKDHYSGAGNAVNEQFGANIVGARPGYYIKAEGTSTSYETNSPIDYSTVTDWQYNSAYNPDIEIQCTGDGGVFTGSGANGCVTGITFDVEFGGLMNLGGTDAIPFNDGAECHLEAAVYDSDATPGYNFAISNITQANPAVVTFTNSIYEQSGPKTFNDIAGMTELNAQLVFAKGIAHNQVELYTDSALTTGVDSTGYTAYTGGGNMQDYDNNVFGQVDVFDADFDGRTLSGSHDNFAPMPLDTTAAGSFDQEWPTTVSPAKMNMTLIHPTRKTYGQDLTRYTNSTGAYGYRLTVEYKNISKTAWRELDGFIKTVRGATAPFKFTYVGGDSGNGYEIFENDETVEATWIAAEPVLAKDAAAGDAAIFLTGFKPDQGVGTDHRKISTYNDVFFNARTYRGVFSYNNVAYASGNFETNEFGEAILRFTSPLKTAKSTLDGDIYPAAWKYFQCMLADDEIEYDWHPTGNFVSFKVDMDVI